MPLPPFQSWRPEIVGKTTYYTVVCDGVTVSLWRAAAGWTTRIVSSWFTIEEAVPRDEGAVDYCQRRIREEMP